MVSSIVLEAIMKNQWFKRILITSLLIVGLFIVADTQAGENVCPKCGNNNPGFSFPRGAAVKIDEETHYYYIHQQFTCGTCRTQWSGPVNKYTEKHTMVPKWVKNSDYDLVKCRYCPYAYYAAHSHRFEEQPNPSRESGGYRYTELCECGQTKKGRWERFKH